MASPPPIPVSLRLSELKGMRNRPPIDARVDWYAYPLTVTDTAARLPPPRAVTTSSGTGIPVLLPVCAMVVSNRMAAVSRDDGPRD